MPVGKPRREYEAGHRARLPSHACQPSIALAGRAPASLPVFSSTSTLSRKGSPCRTPCGNSVTASTARSLSRRTR
eukprot:scaffold141473_cov36-Tisochrysis_lutea.AAC.1